MTTIPIYGQARRGARRTGGFLVVTALLALAVIYAVTQQAPRVSVRPGPVVDLAAHATASFPDRGGSWLATTVRADRLTLWGRLAARPGGETRVVDAAPGAADESMRESQTTSTLLASMLTRRAAVGARGAQIVACAPDSPAWRAGLRPGDVIVRVDGRLVQRPADLDVPAAGAVRLLVAPGVRGREGVTSLAPAREAELALPADDSLARAAGVRLASPRVAAFTLPGVQGPSAGLMMTLAHLDALTPGRLNGGRVIAGTGSVGLSGQVGAVSEVGLKMRGASRARAQVFFVPAPQYRQAAQAASGRVTIVPVSTVQDAVVWLCAHGGVSTACPSAP
ncbi:PDZ domain-containing protein [Bailinhaonella thermotolerans]|uniref:PDZ domain-containing protein n=1 Tax=Bailinhaonella thermotolerans TaxID=1070861 RepID=A0A3A4AJZ0_9ACTN|nr:PDZ domain-containing protein [Bailinhaonella thermotolerans]RJL21255.1 PDZ domain-containing protein [Bailinhaonella thermotolerans]